MQTKLPFILSQVFFTCLFLARPAGAASFDCAKAKTDVEKAICGDPVLSSLDEQLNKAYQAAMKSSEAAGDIQAQQQQWLIGTRDKCQDKACWQNAYQARIAELTSVADRQWPRYQDQALGIELSYPPERQISKNCHGSNQCVALVSEQMPAGNEYFLAFEIFEGNLQQVAANQAIFSQHSGGWMAHGRNGTYPVQFLEGDGWLGFYAVVDCGITDEEGFFHAAGGECYWAVLSNGKQSVVIDSEGLAADPKSRRSVESFKFAR